MGKIRVEKTSISSRRSNSISNTSNSGGGGDVQPHISPFLKPYAFEESISARGEEVMHKTNTTGSSTRDAAQSKYQDGGDKPTNPNPNTSGPWAGPGRASSRTESQSQSQPRTDSQRQPPNSTSTPNHPKNLQYFDSFEEFKSYCIHQIIIEEDKFEPGLGGGSSKGDSVSASGAVESTIDEHSVSSGHASNYSIRVQVKNNIRHKIEIVVQNGAV